MIIMHFSCAAAPDPSPRPGPAAGPAPAATAGPASLGQGQPFAAAGSVVAAPRCSELLPPFCGCIGGGGNTRNCSCSRCGKCGCKTCQICDNGPGPAPAPAPRPAPAPSRPDLVNPCLNKSAEYSKQPWCDASLPVDERVTDMLSRMTLAEKVGSWSSAAVAIPSLGLPKYNWWAEATHGLLLPEDRSARSSNFALPARAPEFGGQTRFPTRTTVYDEAFLYMVKWGARILHIFCGRI